MEIYNDLVSRDEILSHHGIKGQKHGVRRFQNEDGSWTAAGRLRYGKSSDRSEKRETKRAAKKEAKVKKKEMAAKQKEVDKAKAEADKQAELERKRPIKDLSDDEVRARIERLQLEKRYRDLFKEVNPPVTKGAKTFVKNLLVDSGKTALTEVTKKTATYLVGSMVDKALGVKVNTGKVKKDDKKKDDDD